MNNLFLREKESWAVWLIWGVFAASAVFITATNTQNMSHLFLLKFGIFAMLTWYMTYSKRFSFWRAMKISFVVFSLTIAPVLFFNFEVISLLKNADIAVRVAILFVVGAVCSLVSSLIARQPKEYY